MANDFKLKTKASVGITTENVYVVPSSPTTTTTVIGITLCNTSGSGINVGVGITRSGFDDIKILKNVPIPVSYTHLTLPTNREV